MDNDFILLLMIITWCDFNAALVDVETYFKYKRKKYNLSFSENKPNHLLQFPFSMFYKF